MNLYELDIFIQDLIDNDENELVEFYLKKREELVKKIKTKVLERFI